MARFGRQHDVARRRDAKRAEEEFTGQRYVRPDDPMCEEVKVPYDIDDPEYLISQRLVYLGEKLVEFAIILTRTPEWAEPFEVYSIDTKHGSLHEHVNGHHEHGTAREIKPLYSQVDVQESLDDPAMKMILERYKRLQ